VSGQGYIYNKKDGRPSFLKGVSNYCKEE